ncbi:unnamed protein product [Soboliphyme baturini]|uniref:Kunitz/Bovine pancreatic trypsin inhibitor domain protein n=1 Tax=Soboliphyme baturini TaxID=241478 RepID=A0A183IYM1_9BILA|nr:unnamed protein product [Soboliphyme baturini]
MFIELNHSIPMFVKRPYFRNETRKDTRNNICLHPKSEGTCRGIFPRWYYVPDLDICKSFVYGGCAGNGNNFNSKLACELKCKRRNCGKFQLRFFYNQELGQCEYFFFSGCNGNENNFKTLEACEMLCGDKRVVPFAFGDNNTAAASEEDPVEKELLGLPMPPSNNEQTDFVSGYGKPANMPTPGPPGLVPNPPGYAPSRPSAKDRETMKMIKLAYGAKQPVVPSEAVSTCQLKPERGPCGDAESRWFWNETAGMCEIFEYSGCKGNANNFETEKACTDKCANLTANVCDHPKDEGLCGATFTRYFYDKTINSCVVFNYTGCGGNGNNFDSILECQKMCLKIDSSLKTTKVPSATLKTSVTYTATTTPTVAHLITKVVPTAITVAPTASTAALTTKTVAPTTTTAAPITATVSEAPEINATASVTCKQVKCRAHCMVIRDKNNCKSCYCPHRTTTPPPPCKPLDEEQCSDRSCIVVTDDQECKVCLCPSVTSEQNFTTIATAIHLPVIKTTVTVAVPLVDFQTHPQPSGHVTTAPTAITEFPEVPQGISPAAEDCETQFQSPQHIATAPATTTECAEAPKGPDPAAECYEPLDSGKCTGPFVERWWFDGADSQCKPFQYSGCGGNRNHFFSFEECQMYCKKADMALSSKQGDSVVDELFDVRISYCLGNYQACINEAQKLKPRSDDIGLLADTFIFLSYIAQHKYNIALEEINDASPLELKTIRLLAKYLQDSRVRWF